MPAFLSSIVRHIMPSFLCAFFAHHCANLRPSVSITPDGIRHLLPKSFQVASTSLAASTPCADLTLRLDIKNSGPFLKIRCKDSVKVTLVFLQRQKFFQKIVFFPFSGLIKEPFDGGIYSFVANPVLRSHHFSRLTSRSPFVSRHKIIIDYGLIAYFYLMPFLRHPKLIRVSYQIRYVI